nr:ImmA/IrrE family metallo-endopeptidase [uncultured Flavobacterium sp.]
MASTSILKRGFKAKAEKIATECRENLNIHPCAPLCAFKLAQYLNVSVYNATEFLKDDDEIKRLEGKEAEEYGWSALTMNTKIGNRIIIHNNFHNPYRQQSNIMHEIAHILCKHEVKELPQGINLPFGMRDFDKLQEEEAICLGATLQLSKPCLLWARKRNMTNNEIASHFNASVEMVNFRMSMTGLNKPFFRKKAS